MDARISARKSFSLSELKNLLSAHPAIVDKEIRSHGFLRTRAIIRFSQFGTFRGKKHSLAHRHTGSGRHPLVCILQKKAFDLFANRLQLARREEELYRHLLLGGPIHFRISLKKGVFRGQQSMEDSGGAISHVFPAGQVLLNGFAPGPKVRRQGGIS